MRRSAVLVVAMAMLAASTLAAQTAPADGVEIAVTYAGQRSIVTGPGNGFWLQGVAADASLPVYRGFSLAANFTFGHSGDTGGAGSPLDVATTVAGPRFTGKAAHGRKLRPALFGEALFGVAHGFNSIFPEGSSTPSSASSFALMTGGGIDLPIGRWVSLRLIQADYLRSTLPNGGANVQNSLRIAAGVNLTMLGRNHRK